MSACEAQVLAGLQIDFTRTVCLKIMVLQCLNDIKMPLQSVVTRRASATNVNYCSASAFLYGLAMEATAEEDDDCLNKGNLEAMTIPALKHLCKEHGLEREGTYRLKATPG